MTGNQLRARRERLGLTQAELARRLKLKWEGTVNRWETGKIKVPYVVELALKQIESEEKK